MEVELLELHADADATLVTAWEEKNFQRVSELLEKDAGFALKINDKGAVSEIEAETVAFLQKYFKTANHANKAKPAANTSAGSGHWEFRIVFKEQHQFGSRAAVLELLRNYVPDSGLQLQRTIPLQNGWCCRGTAKGMEDKWQTFKVVLQKIGVVEVLGVEELQQDKKARTELAETSKRVVSQGDWVKEMLQLRPGGGKPSKLRRSIDKAIAVTYKSNKVGASRLKAAESDDSSGEEHGTA